MSDTPSSAAPSRFECHVLPGWAFKVTSGANRGDALEAADALNPGDTYRLSPEAQAAKLSVIDGGTGAGRVLRPGADVHRLAEGSEMGAPGAALSLTARLTLVAPEGHSVDLLLLNLDREGPVALPLEPMEPGRDHTLIAVDPAPEAVALADITSVAFGHGTRITLGDGTQRPVDALRTGDLILTRDNGSQPLRWIVKRTVRAVGPYAPVVIPHGLLGNTADLALSQHQRLFVYQRQGERLTESAEMWVRAHYLVDGDQVFLRSGGFVDYYTLVFDGHEVIYAECLPVESLEVSPATRPALPPNIAQEVRRAMPDLRHRPHVGIEADRATAEATRDRLLKDRS